jgi:beta-lactamase regulating signal transducer with metallopeptidase domain
MNAFATSAIEWAARGLVLSSLLALIVSAIWLVWGRRLPARLAYGLVLLPLLPLVLPRYTTWDWQVHAESSWTLVGERAGFVRADSAASLAEGFVMQELIEEAPASFDALDPPNALALVFPPAAEEKSARDELAPAPGDGFPWAKFALALWASGAGLLLLSLAASIRRTERQLADAQAPDASSEARLRRLIPRRSALRFLRSAAVSSPAAWGIRDKRIVLPIGLEDELDDDQLAWVLRHELAHHQRGDLWMSVLQRVVQIVWWFHPLLWLWQSRIELARECACDEAAARSLRSDLRPAATALLAVASRPTAPHAGALALHSLHRNARLMKTRLTRILQPRTSRLAGFATAALCAFLAGGTLLLSQSVFAAAPAGATPTPAASPAPISQEPEPEPTPVPEEIVEEPVEIEEVVEKVWPESIGSQMATPFPSMKKSIDLQTDTVLRNAQLWLLRQQQKDGSWPTGKGTNEASGEFTTIGVTALALLALEVPMLQIANEEWRAAMIRGVNYLGSCWDQERRLFVNGKPGVRALPDHALATYAVIRLRGFGSGWAWGVIYHDAVETLLKAQNPYGGWRYGLEPDGDNDSIMTSLVLRSLAEASKHGQFKLDQLPEGALNFLDEMTDPATGRVGYQKKGSADPRFRDRADDYPVKYTELCTALSSVARISIGQDLLDNETTLRSLTLLASKPPVWNQTHGSVDFYYWMYGAEAMHQIGGRLADRWHGSLQAVLIKHQDPAGFWPAVDAWSTPGANVHSTACALLAWTASRGYLH